MCTKQNKPLVIGSIFLALRSTIILFTSTRLHSSTSSYHTVVKRKPYIMKYSSVSFLWIAFVALLVATCCESKQNRDAPHIHRGVLSSYEPGPFDSVDLDEKDEKELKEGKPIMKMTPAADGELAGSSICVQDIEAPKVGWFYAVVGLEDCLPLEFWATVRKLTHALIIFHSVHSICRKPSGNRFWILKLTRERCQKSTNARITSKRLTRMEPLPSRPKCESALFPDTR